jgi:ABC-type nitrate/sulfonate/bicarbonate transport system permease component
MEILSHTIDSCVRVLIGVSCAVLLGIGAGLLRHQAPNALKHNFLFRFLLEAPKFPPPIAWIPFVIITFGIGQLSAVIIVIIGAFSPVFTATYDACENIPQELRDTLASFEITGAKRIFGFSLMASLPQIFSGIRSGLGMGWMSVIAAEMISGQSGLGYAIQQERLNMDYGSIAIYMVIIGLVGFLSFEILKLIEKKFFPWFGKS